MILPTAAITTALLLAPLVASNPTPPRHQAQVVPIRQKRGFSTSPDKPFDAAAAQAERNKISDRYANLASKKRSVTTEARREFKAEAIEPFDIQSLKKRQSSGENSLEDAQDAVYYGALSIGTPPQQTTIDFDTGSADLIIPTENCSGCGSPLFNTAQSSTFQASSQPFDIQYGDGSQAVGTLAADTVTVAGLTVQNQVFAAITQESGPLTAGGVFAGLMGMGFPSLAKSGATPFFFNLAQSNALTSNVFSFYLARGDNTGSELCIGCTDSSKYTGNVNFYPLDASATQGQQVYWSIMADGMTVNGQTTPALSCVMDTGTTAIYVPMSYAQTIWANIPGATPAPGQPEGSYAYPCGQQIPEVAFVFGGQSYAIDPTDFNLGAVTSDGSLCMGAIMGQDTQGVNFAIVGDAFLKNWYSIYDAGGSRVGLAKSNQ